jgi:hypothetical protein
MDEKLEFDAEVESSGSLFKPETRANNYKIGEQKHNDVLKLMSSEKDIHCFNPLIFTKFILDSSNNNTAK